MRTLLFSIFVLLSLHLGSAQAHSVVQSTFPSDGAELEASPESIGISFSTQLRLTLFRVSHENGEVELANAPASELGDRFQTAPLAPLASGRYQVEWRALAADGHLMSGSFGFSVLP